MTSSNFKKLTAFTLTAILALALSGCGAVVEFRDGREYVTTIGSDGYAVTTWDPDVSGEWVDKNDYFNDDPTNDIYIDVTAFGVRATVESGIVTDPNFSSQSYDGEMTLGDPVVWDEETGRWDAGVTAEAEDKNGVKSITMQFGVLDELAADGSLETIFTECWGEKGDKQIECVLTEPDGDHLSGSPTFTLNEIEDNGLDF